MSEEPRTRDRDLETGAGIYCSEDNIDLNHIYPSANNQLVSYLAEREIKNTIKEEFHLVARLPHTELLQSASESKTNLDAEALSKFVETLLTDKANSSLLQKRPFLKWIKLTPNAKILLFTNKKSKKKSQKLAYSVKNKMSFKEYQELIDAAN